MEPNFDDIDLIVLKYVRYQSLTADELTRLRQWLAQADDPDRMALVERLRTDPEWVQAQLHRLQQVDVDGIWSKVESRLHPAAIPLRSQSRRRWWLYAAAAFIFVALGAWLLVSRRPAPLVTPAAPAVATTSDVQPGGNRAVLTLADGRKIDLGATANGVVADQGSTRVDKVSDGHLAYKTAGEKPVAAAAAAVAVAYNSLSTPRAGQFTLRLPDGTNVWLNNASTIRYPVAFTGADRTVELTGEAYFEVAKDAAHPFRVTVAGGGPTVDVLGTAFNIMAYTDEPTQHTTLLAGSIRVTEAGQSTLLKPAEQTALDARGKLQVIPDVNVQEVIAWKNGYFHFDHSSLQSTMRQLARWYDVDVVYKGQIPEKAFSGKIQRDLPLQKILKALENDEMHFQLNGRQLVVTP